MDIPGHNTQGVFPTGERGIGWSKGSLLSPFHTIAKGVIRLYPDNGITTPDPAPMPCSDSCGSLPECAPLAVPYVPFQQKNAKQYAPSDALNNGTLFPGLNLPFHVKSKPNGNAASGALGELQALEFVVVELGLYLDTHRDDKEAFTLFQKYTALEREARTRYEAAYGPILRSSMETRESYDWLNDPWPWNYGEGGEK